MKFLIGTKNCFGFGKDGHNVRDFTNGAAKGRKTKQDHPRVLEGDVPKNNHLYHSGLRDQSRMIMNMLVSYNILFFSFMISF